MNFYLMFFFVDVEANPPKIGFFELQEEKKKMWKPVFYGSLRIWQIQGIYFKKLPKNIRLKANMTTA